MNTLLLMMIIQGCLGAFDTLYHHEFTERLPWKPQAAQELWIHGVRNFFYAVIFASLGWVAWGGWLAYLFAAMLLGEIGLTLWDFVIEDRTRKLPASERITHTILAINYGVILALLAPEMMRWAALPAAFYIESHGLWSWTMSLFALGVFAWAVFDYTRSKRFKLMQIPLVLHLNTPHQRILVTGGTGLIGSRLCQALIDDGHDMTILTRDKTKAAKFKGRITLIDRLEDLRSVDIIINLAGESLSNGLWTRTKKQALYDSRLKLTRSLTDWIATAPEKPKHLINASAIGYYGHSETWNSMKVPLVANPTSLTTFAGNGKPALGRPLTMASRSVMCAWVLSWRWKAARWRKCSSRSSLVSEDRWDTAASGCRGFISTTLADS